MHLECQCGKWHYASETALVLIILAYQDGELHRMTRDGLTPLCMGEAFTAVRINQIRARYKSNAINFDGVHY